MSAPPDNLKRLYEEILADVDGLTTRIIAAIRTEIPGYDQFPYDIHVADNLVNLTLQLQLLVSGDRPPPEALEHAREMARTRAEMGVPLTQAIGGYHVGFRELWAEVARRAGNDRALQALLPLEVERIWGWFHLVSSAYAEEYMRATRSRALTLADSLRRLLTEPDETATHLDEIVTDLGYDISRPIRVFVVAVQPAQILARLNSDLAQLPDAAYSASVGIHTVVVGQELTTAAGVTALRAAGIRGPIAVGLARHGARGIRESFIDGVRLLELPHDDANVREYDRQWPLTLLNADHERMRELLAPGIAAVRDHEHIAQVVVAFATNGYSISATARALHIHPNTARYRITRWRELTGWDLFTVRGLLSSLAALQDAGTPMPRIDLG